MSLYRQGAWDDLYAMPLEVAWNFTKMCNYKCSYCYGQLPVDVKQFSSMEQITNAVRHIAEIKCNSYQISFAGGECTIHPHFLDTVELLSETLGERINCIYIISNGSRNDSFFEHIRTLSNKVNINMIISIHTEYMKIKDIVSLIEKNSNHIGLSFQLMVNPEKRDYVKEIFDELIRLRGDYAFGLSVMTLREPPSFDNIDKRYTEDDLNWIREMNTEFKDKIKNKDYPKFFPHQKPNNKQVFFDEVIDGKRNLDLGYDYNSYFHQGKLNFKGMKCISGSTILSIKADGTCTGILCGATKKTCNIYEKNPYDDPEWIHAVDCPMDNCGCPTNIHVMKFKDGYEAEMYMRNLKSRLNTVGCGI